MYTREEGVPANLGREEKLTYVEFWVMYFGSYQMKMYIGNMW